MASGSKKSRAGKPPEPPPELRPWQILVLDAVAASPLGAELTLGGGTALAAVYLHHRVSEDLDFFAMREIEQHELRPIARALATKKVQVDQRVEGPRRILELSRNDEAVGHVDLSYYPFDPIDRPTRWHRLRVDSLIDMAVNKVQAILTRSKPRDHVDLYFLLREGAERDLGRLLALVRAKFDVGADPLTLAERLLHFADIPADQLPPLLRPVPIDDLRVFFEDLARRLVRGA